MVLNYQQNAGNTDVNVVPGERQERLRRQNKVRLWYVGVDFERTIAGKSRQITIKGNMTRTMPKLGEWIELGEVYAKDLIFATTLPPRAAGQGKRIAFLSDEEGGEQVARAIRSAVERGENLDELNVGEIAAQHILETQIDDDTLIAALKARMSSNPDLVKMLTEDDTEKPNTRKRKTTKKDTTGDTE